LSAYHAPVLVEEVVKLLGPERGGLYLDGTVGGGGHSEAILDAGEEAGARVVGVDRDPEAVAASAVRLASRGKRFEARRGSFAEVADEFDAELAGALLDLGISSHQIEARERGFSFRAGSPLDMRMGPAEGVPTAADILNEYEQEDLVRVLREYGEEPRSRAIARRVVARRVARPFRTSDDLNEVLAEVYGRGLTPQVQARIYQALRIEVNGELEALDRALDALREALAPAGRLVVIAYHSLEDRRVKNAFREWSRSCICPPELPVCVCRGTPLGETLTRKPVRPTPEELERNPRSRSARLRGWRKAA
jgi:16S rRNA (cytosine1402-N4)-methyltransferase